MRAQTSRTWFIRRNRSVLQNMQFEKINNANTLIHAKLNGGELR